MSELESMGTASEGGSYESALAEGIGRFLAHMLHNALAVGVRSPDDFVRHFPPARLMLALVDEPEIRAALLSATTGMNERVAGRKTAESAGDDLQIALDEGVTNTHVIATLFTPDLCVSFLPGVELWAYATESEFWAVTEEQGDPHRRASRHMAYILRRALIEQLIEPRDVVDAIQVSNLARYLPRHELERIIDGTLETGRSGAAFGDADLLTMVPPSSLVSHIPLAIIWERLFVPEVAVPYELIPEPPSMTTEPIEPEYEMEYESITMPPDSIAAPPAVPHLAAPRVAPERRAPELDVDVDVDSDR